MSEFSPPPSVPPADVPPPFGPSEHLSAGTVLPAAPPEGRGRGRAAMVTTLVVLLVLVAGGAAYGWSFLNRADVRLARAFDSTRSSAGDLTVSVEGAEESPQVRYAWTADGTAQVQVSLAEGGVALDVITTSDHLVLRIDPAAVPEGTAALAQLRTIADTFGPDGAALTALADGKPVGVAIGPGSRLQELIDEAGSISTPNRDATAVQEQISAVADAVVGSVRDNVTVEPAGSDQHGDRSTVTLPLKPVVARALESLKGSVPALGDTLTGADLTGIDGRTVRADVWISDGRLARVAVPFAQFGDAGASGTLVVTFGTAGVVRSQEQVTEVSDALLDKLLGGLPALTG